MALGLYGFTKYDGLGRVIAHGTSSQNVAAEAFAQSVDVPGFPTSTTEQTTLAYDEGATVTYLDGTPQRYLRGRLRVATSSDGVETHYSYDPHGNIVWSAQKLPGNLRRNFTRYEFDLISGNVTRVIYNEGRADQFIHRYTYDDDHRLVEVATSRDSVVWDSDARYSYYEHGPLRRIELGEDRVQGLDYVYTLGGQLKAINHPSLTVATDPGGDATSASRVAADSFALALHYNEDFTPLRRLLESFDRPSSTHPARS